MNKKIFVSFLLSAVLVVGVFAFAAPARAEASSLWGAANEQLGANASASSIMSLAKSWATQFNISVPEWGINGVKNARALSKAFFQSIIGERARAQTGPAVTLNATKNSDPALLSSGVNLTAADIINFDYSANSDNVNNLTTLKGCINVTSGGFSISLPACKQLNTSGPGLPNLSDSENYNLAAAAPGTCAIFTATATDVAGFQDFKTFYFCVDAPAPTISNQTACVPSSSQPCAATYNPTVSGNPPVYVYPSVTNSQLNLSGTIDNLDATGANYYDFEIRNNSQTVFQILNINLNAPRVSSYPFSTAPNPIILSAGQNVIEEVLITRDVLSGAQISSQVLSTKQIEYIPAPSIANQAVAFPGTLTPTPPPTVTQGPPLTYDYGTVYLTNPNITVSGTFVNLDTANTYDITIEHNNSNPNVVYQDLGFTGVSSRAFTSGVITLAIGPNIITERLQCQISPSPACANFVVEKLINYQPVAIAPTISLTSPGACVTGMTCNFGDINSSMVIAGNLDGGVTSFTLSAQRPGDVGFQPPFYSIGFLPDILTTFSTSYDFNAGPGTYIFLAKANNGSAGAGNTEVTLQIVVNFVPAVAPPVVTISTVVPAQTTETAITIEGAVTAPPGQFLSGDLCPSQDPAGMSPHACTRFDPRLTSISSYSFSVTFPLTVGINTLTIRYNDYSNVEPRIIEQVFVVERIAADATSPTIANQTFRADGVELHHVEQICSLRDCLPVWEYGTIGGAFLEVSGLAVDETALESVLIELINPDGSRITLLRAPNPFECRNIDGCPLNVTEYLFSAPLPDALPIGDYQIIENITDVANNTYTFTKHFTIGVPITVDYVPLSGSIIAPTTPITATANTDLALATAELKLNPRAAVVQHFQDGTANFLGTAPASGIQLAFTQALDPICSTRTCQRGSITQVNADPITGLFLSDVTGLTYPYSDPNAVNLNLTVGVEVMADIVLIDGVETATNLQVIASAAPILALTIGDNNRPTEYIGPVNLEVDSKGSFGVVLDGLLAHDLYDNVEIDWDGVNPWMSIRAHNDAGLVFEGTVTTLDFQPKPLVENVDYSAQRVIREQDWLTIFTPISDWAFGGLTVCNSFGDARCDVFAVPELPKEPAILPAAVILAQIAPCDPIRDPLCGGGGTEGGETFIASYEIQDLVNPVLTVNPLPVSTSEQITISGSVTDRETKAVLLTLAKTLDGALIGLDNLEILVDANGDFAYTPVLTDQGDYSFTSTAYDAAGNIAVAMVKTTYVLARLNVSVQETVAAGNGAAIHMDTALETKVFSSEAGSCASNIGTTPKNYVAIYSNCRAEATALETFSPTIAPSKKPRNLIDPDLKGINITTGSKLVLVKSRPAGINANGASSYMGFDLPNMQAGESRDVGFNRVPGQPNVFVQKSMFSQNSKYQWSGSNRAEVIQGSELYVYRPDFVEWTNGDQIYPFTFISDSDWDLNVCLQVPAGYTIVAPGTCDQTLISNEARIVEFTVAENVTGAAAVLLAQAGAPEPNFTFTLNTKHKEAGSTVVKETNTSYQVSGLSAASKRASDLALAPVIAQEKAKAVVLAQAEQAAQGQAVSAIAQTFQLTLAPGTQSADVLRLQRYLNSKGFTLASSGAGSPGNETNFFGPRTREALRRFQEANRIAILAPLGLLNGTGIFGPATRAFINASQ